MGVDIGNSGKLCSRYNCYYRNGKPWGVKEVGDTGYIRNSIEKLFCSIRESLIFPYLVGAAEKY